MVYCVPFRRFIWMFPLLVVGAAACTSPQQYIDVACSRLAGDTIVDREAAIQCQTFKQTEAATAAYNEATLLMRSYRACLEKYETLPAKSKEYCAQYPKALRDIGLQITEPAEPTATSHARKDIPPSRR